MTPRAEVPADIVAKLRAICLALPAAYEEAAWVGTRWMIGKKNFAHVVMIDGGWPPAYAKAAKRNGPVAVLTFRSPLTKTDASRFAGPPFFRPVWFPNIVGVAIEEGTDWEEIADLLAESYRVLAPKTLIQSIGRDTAG